MPLLFVINPPHTDDLRDAIVELWQSASDAGGGLGFPAGLVKRDMVAAATDASLAGVAAGHDHLCLAYETPAGEIVGAFFLCDMRFALSNHHRLVKRLMVRPDRQGHGYGLELLHEAERLARDDGAEALRLTARGGLGLERFYEKAGFQEVGRYPGALRIAPHDDRDEIHFWRPLT